MIVFAGVHVFMKHYSAKACYSLFTNHIKKGSPTEKHRRNVKAAQYVWTTSYFILMTVYGYYLFQDSAWLPWYMGGNGSWDQIWKDMPFVKPVNGAMTYAMIQLGYHLGETVTHVFFEAHDNDFYEMLLHHLCTLFLLLCMTFSNFLAIGCVINLLHDVSDVIPGFVKIASACIYDDLTIFLFVNMTLIWFYFRNLILSYMVFRIWTETEYPQEWAYFQPVISFSASMLTALVFL
jgi:hypothetical protein